MPDNAGEPSFAIIPHNGPKSGETIALGEGDYTYDSDTNKLTVSGEKLIKKAGGEVYIDLTSKADVVEGEKTLEAKGEIALPLREAEYELDQQEDMDMLVGWTHVIDTTGGFFVRNKEYPYGWHDEYNVRSVSVKEPDNGAISITPPGEEDDRYEIRARKEGKATVEVVYEPYWYETDDDLESYTFDVNVTNEFYSVETSVDGPTRTALPGETISVEARVTHFSSELEDGEEDVTDDEDITYTWSVDDENEGDDYASVPEHGDAGNAKSATVAFYDCITLKTNDVYRDGEDFWKDVDVDVAVSKSGKTVASNHERLNASNDFCEIRTFRDEDNDEELEAFDLGKETEEMEVGQSVTATFRTVHRFIDPEKDSETQDVSYSQSTENVEEVTYDWSEWNNGGEDDEDDDEDYQPFVTIIPVGTEETPIFDESGEGKDFTITRHGEWDQDIQLFAKWGDDGECDRNYHFRDKNYDMELYGDDELYTDRDLTLTLDTREIRDELFAEEGLYRLAFEVVPVIYNGDGEDFWDDDDPDNFKPCDPIPAVDTEDSEKVYYSISGKRITLFGNAISSYLADNDAPGLLAVRASVVCGSDDDEFVVNDEMRWVQVIREDVDLNECRVVLSGKPVNDEYHFSVDGKDATVSQEELGIQVIDRNDEVVDPEAYDISIVRTFYDNEKDRDIRIEATSPFGIAESDKDEGFTQYEVSVTAKDDSGYYGENWASFVVMDIHSLNFICSTVDYDPCFKRGGWRMHDRFWFLLGAGLDLDGAITVTANDGTELDPNDYTLSYYERTGDVDDGNYDNDFSYYLGTNKPLDAAPTEPGEYFVRVSAAENSGYYGGNDVLLDIGSFIGINTAEGEDNIVWSDEDKDLTITLPDGAEGTPEFSISYQGSKGRVPLDKSEYTYAAATGTLTLKGSKLFDKFKQDAWLELFASVKDGDEVLATGSAEFEFREAIYDYDFEDEEFDSERDVRMFDEEHVADRYGWLYVRNSEIPDGGHWQYEIVDVGIEPEAPSGVVLNPDDDHDGWYYKALKAGSENLIVTYRPYGWTDGDQTASYTVRYTAYSRNDSGIEGMTFEGQDEQGWARFYVDEDDTMTLPDFTLQVADPFEEDVVNDVSPEEYAGKVEIIVEKEIGDNVFETVDTDSLTHAENESQSYRVTVRAIVGQGLANRVEKWVDVCSRTCVAPMGADVEFKNAEQYRYLDDDEFFIGWLGVYCVPRGITLEPVVSIEGKTLTAGKDYKYQFAEIDEIWYDRDDIKNLEERGEIVYKDGFPTGYGNYLMRITGTGTSGAGYYGENSMLRLIISDNPEADAVQAAIDALDPINPNPAAVSRAREAYNKLSSSEKTLINISKLTSSEKRLSDIARAKAEAERLEWEGTQSSSIPKVKGAKNKAGKKKVTVSWKKLDKKKLKKFDKIEIQVCPDTRFAKANTIRKEVKKTKKSVTIKSVGNLKLQSKKKYFVRVRNVKGSGTGKIVSGWSKYKAVKIK